MEGLVMNFVVCPHCKTHQLMTSRVPRDVIVVIPCPSCQELAVVFRDKVIALSRRVIEEGTFDERKTHLAEVIAEFLEAGIFPLSSEEEDAETEDTPQPSVPRLEWRDAKRRRPRRRIRPISDQEVDKFLKFDLKRIDNAAYFKRHFG